MFKLYANSKDWRKPYKGAAAFDRTCRCHGGCPYCEDNRKHFDKKRRKAAEQDLKNFYQD